MPPIDTQLRDETVEVATLMNKSAPNSPSSTKECDFDKDPTALYLATQKKDWEVALTRSVEAPHEASTWVSRKEADGKLRWRLLPLHAAIIFKAPENVVEAFLSAYPKGAECKDDQGMLPLHLAFRNGSTEGIVNLLLVAYPQSIDIQDRKGRIPLVLAQASTSPNRDAFMRALERGPTYYAVAAAATERAAVTAELRAIFDSKLIEIKTLHQEEMSSIQDEAKETKAILEQRVEDLETELLKTQETSQVLVDHVNSLDAQLAARSETERFLATKIATIDSSLKIVTAEKEELERNRTVELGQLQGDMQALLLKYDTLQTQHAETTAKLAIAEETVVKTEEEKLLMTTETTNRETKLEMDYNIAKANAAILEAQMKNKMHVEHSLASQITALTYRLAEALGESSNIKLKYTEQIKELEKERDSLQAHVDDLTNRLQNVAKALDVMSIEQEVIVKAAAHHEATMAEAAMAQAKIAAEACSQEEMWQKGIKEREEIMKMIARQEEEAAKFIPAQASITKAVKEQEQRMSTWKTQREAMVTQVSKQRDYISALINIELNLSQSRSLAENDDDDEDDVAADANEVVKEETAEITDNTEAKVSVEEQMENTEAKVSVEEQMENTEVKVSVEEQVDTKWTAGQPVNDTDTNFTADEPQECATESVETSVTVTTTDPQSDFLETETSEPAIETESTNLQPFDCVVSEPDQAEHDEVMESAMRNQREYTEQIDQLIRESLSHPADEIEENLPPTAIDKIEEGKHD